jgi:hypothetical protein
MRWRSSALTSTGSFTHPGSRLRIFLAPTQTKGAPDAETRGRRSPTPEHGSKGAREQGPGVDIEVAGGSPKRWVGGGRRADFQSGGLPACLISRSPTPCYDFDLIFLTCSKPFSDNLKRGGACVSGELPESCAGPVPARNRRGNFGTSPVLLPAMPLGRMW